MPRIGKVQPCIFCGEVPCACNGKPSKPTVARKKLAPAQRVPDPDDLVVDRPADDPFGDLGPARNDRPSRFKKVEEQPAETTQDERELHQAIRNLAAGDVLHYAELQRYKDIIDPPIPAEVDRQLHDWKRRNGKG